MTLIEKARDKRRELSSKKDLRAEHNLIKKHLSNPSSKKIAIDAFCFHCMGGTKDELPDPGWKDLIKTCTAPTCPLYLHRPYQQKEQK